MAQNIKMNGLTPFFTYWILFRATIQRINKMLISKDRLLGFSVGILCAALLAWVVYLLWGRDSPYSISVIFPENGPMDIRISDSKKGLIDHTNSPLGDGSIMTISRVNDRMLGLVVGEVSEGLLHGEFKKYHIDHSGVHPMFDLAYEYGRLNGSLKSWYLNGMLLSNISFKDGMFDGCFEFYYSDGSLAVRANFVNNRYEGTQFLYDANGLPALSATYSEGELIDGIWIKNLQEFINSYIPGGKDTVIMVTERKNGELEDRIVVLKDIVGDVPSLR